MLDMMFNVSHHDIILMLDVMPTPLHFTLPPVMH
jgi:hypothetical protein